MNKLSESSRRSLLLRKLEDRVLFDALADAAAWLSSDPGVTEGGGEAADEACWDTATAAGQFAACLDAAPSESVEPEATQTGAITHRSPGPRDNDQPLPALEQVAGRRELVIVDPAVENYQQLVDDLLGHQDDSQRALEVVLLDTDRNGIEQVSEILAERSQLDAVHLVSHGDEAAFRLGNQWVDAENVAEFSEEFARWGTAFSESGDLLLYGCDVAATPEGMRLVETLSALTGTDVAASNDDTGSAARGGDWHLEFHSGAVETPLAFSNQLQRDYQGLLAVGPAVSLNVPATAMIGEAFTFDVVFTNTGNPGEIGYGPYVDLLIPVNGADGNAGQDTPDGIDFVNATYLGTSVNTLEFVFPDDDGAGPGTTGTIAHPYAVDAAGNPLQVTGTAGDKLVVLELPYGSFTPEQPSVDVQVSVMMSDLADLGTPLTVRARGGFMYGADPLNNPAVDPSLVSDSQTDANSWVESGSLTPTLIALTKTANAPEDETATGPNFARQYTISVDIADGQQITDLDVTDLLPNNVVITGVSGGSLVTPVAFPHGPANPPANEVRVNFATVTGTAGGQDAQVVIDFYVPEFDADGNRIIPSSGEDDLAGSIAVNNARAVGDWSPNDPRDAGSIDNAVADPVGDEHLLDAKAIAIQKSVAIVNDVGAANASPGDTLEYTLNFQLSDYFTIGDLLISDTFQDGQLYDSTFLPTFTITDQQGNVTGTFTVRNLADPDLGETLVVDETRIDRTDDAAENPASDGSTTLTFDLSQAMRDAGAADGVLQGGLTSGPANLGGAQGTIRFRTVIQDEFADTFPSGDRSVDHGDILENNVLVISGTIRENEEDDANGTLFEPLGVTESDTSAASIGIFTGVVLKEVYAVNGDTNLPLGPSGQVSVSPGDVVTYRVQYTLPSTSFETLSFTDFFPLPVFDVTDPDADGAAGPGWTFDVANSFDAAPPPSGVVEFGPNDTLYNSAPGASDVSTPAYFSPPQLTTDAAANSLEFLYGTYDDPTQPSTTIDLLFSVTVTNQPFTDGLLLTNLVRSLEGTTNTSALVADAIIQIELNEPELGVTKGVVGSTKDGLGATYDAATGPGGVVFAAPGAAGAPFSGTLHSDGLALQPIDANITDGLDAGDTVRFAIVVENTGGSRTGAFDVQVRDSLPSEYQFVAGSLQVVDGTGAAIAFTDVNPGNPGLFGDGIELADPGPTAPLADGTAGGALDRYDPTSGRNVAIIVYDAVLTDTTGSTADDVEPGETLTNTASLVNFASEEGGPDFTTQDLSDSATTTIANLVATKQIAATSESSTGFVGGIERVTIGEIVRYRLEVAVPEGTSRTLTLRDRLPGGLTFLDDGTATAALVADDPLEFSSTTLPATDGAGNPLVVVGNETTLASVVPVYQLPDAAVSASAGSDNDTYNSGTDVYFRLGDLLNADDDLNVEYVVVEFNAILDNNAGSTTNDQNDTRTNGFDATLNGTLADSSNNVAIRVAEPLINDLAKNVTPNSGDAGDRLDFTVTFSNNASTSRSPAFDATLLDTLPSQYQLDLASVAITLGNGAAGAVDNSSGNTVSIDIGEIPVGGTVQVTYSATLVASVQPGELVTNTANVTYSSLPGINGTAVNPTGSSTPGAPGSSFGERDGSGGANDYRDEDSAQATISPVQVAKQLIGTEIDNTGNASDEVVIGELTTYEITVTIPEGVTNGATLVDTLDAGLAYVELDPANPPVVSGDLTLSGTTNPTVTNNGGTLTWNFGTITNVNRDNAVDETITIRYRAVALNTAGNQGESPATQLQNQAQFSSASYTSPTVSAAPVTVIEPVITLTSAATVGGINGNTTGDAGDAVEYTITLENTGAVDAFDLALLDQLPVDGGGSSLISGPTLQVVDSAGLVTAANFELVGSDATGWLLRTLPGSSFDMLASPGRTITLTVAGTLPPTVQPNQVITHTPEVRWTSLDGDFTSSSRSSFTAAGVERDGTNVADNRHDYISSDPATVTISPPGLAKGLVATDQAVTSDPDVTIGEQVTYSLLVTLPEGATPSVDLVDLIPAGMDYAGFTLVTTAAASGGLLSADFGGNFADGTDPSVTGGAGDGDDVTFAFDQINVDVDNDPTNNSFVLLIDARVLDVPSNVGFGSGQTTLSNQATISIAGGPPQASNLVDVTVVEPNLAITKDIDLLQADAGDQLTVTLTVQNTGPAAAYDVVVEDVLNSAEFDLSSVNLGVSGTNYPADFTATFTPATGLIQYSGGTVPAGGSVSLVFTVDLSDTVAPGATVNNTGVITDATTLPGPVVGERNDPDPDNDNSDTDTDSVGIRRNSLAGSVYSDLDNDGVLDAGEPGVGGVQITLTGTDHLGNSVNLTQNTAGSGAYLFDNLRPGNYVLTESQPAGFLDGTDTAGTQGAVAGNDVLTAISLPTGTETHGTGNNFGELAPASITGFVYHDANNNGSQQGGETGISGVDVRLTGVDDRGQLVDLTLTTGASGSFTFTNLRPSDAAGYTLEQVAQPTGYLDGIDTDGSLANGSTALNDRIQSINLAPGNNGTGYLFGELLPSSLTGFVFHDSDNDGNRAGENGIPGVSVTVTGVDDLGNSVNLTATTDSNGFWQVTGLRPSNGAGYAISESQPPGYLDGADTVGTQGGTAGNDLFTAVIVTSGTAGTENNFGELLPASIGGTVFNDHNNNGAQDPGEPGIQGVTIAIVGTDDRGNPVSLTTTTVADGSYQFTGLRPSDAAGYQLVETQPSAYNDGADTVGSLGGSNAVNDQFGQILVGSGDGGTGYDFGEQGTSVSGSVFVDDNRDGTRDAGEGGLGGIVIELLDATGTVVLDSTTTAPDGSYQFQHLPAGDYQLRETQPPGFSSTTPDLRSVTVPLGGLTDQNFGEARWDLGDFLWFDADGDGIQDPGEPGLGGVDVTLLYAGLDGTFGSGDDVTQSTTTASDGSYQFTELLNGNYRITIDAADLPSGVAATAETDDLNAALDGTSHVVVGGADRFDIDFGFTGSATAGDFVWLDVDGDGNQDAGEPGLANISVDLLFAGADGVFGNADDFSITTSTDSAGGYSFNQLPAGNFQVAVNLSDPDLPSGLAAVSGPESIAGTAAFALATGEVRNDIDFGFTGTRALGDLVWYDRDGDGNADPGEPGFAGVDVTLLYAGQDGTFGNADDVSLSTVTDASGIYQFTQLPDGVYRVSLAPADLPAGLAPTYEVDGSLDNQGQLTLAGADRADADFGFAGSGSIGDYVWLDVDGDGVQEAGEPPLANVEVQLVFAGADGLFGTVDDFTFTDSTDATGLYQFQNLPDGDYRVAVNPADPDLPTGISAVSGPQSVSGTVPVSLTPANRNRSDLDFGFAGTRQVGDFVWFDQDGDGVQDPGEPGLGAVDLALTYAGQDGLFGTADDVSLTTTTDAAGGYQFDSLPDGDYRVALDTADLPVGMTRTFERNDGADTLPDTAEFAVSGGDRLDVDFGYRGSLALGDRFWHDLNADGIQDPGEPGLANVDVTLLSSGADGVYGTADDFTLAATTDSNGVYTFGQLPQGAYRVSYDPTAIPAGMTQRTLEVDDSSVAVDGVANINLTADRADVDFGFAGTYTVGDLVWFDGNGDGAQDPVNEPGLANVRLNLVSAGQDGLFGTADDYTLQTTTDAAGQYQFDNLPEGPYRVSVVTADLPTGVTATAEVDGTLDNLAEFNVTGSRTDVDFGFRGSASLGDFVWYDVNGDGQQDAGEPGIPNAAVTLAFAGTDGAFGTPDDFSLTATTDQSGAYTFANLPAGAYRVDVLGEPSGTTLTAETDDGANLLPGVAEVQLLTSQTRTDVDFGFRGAGALGDTVFYDLNANGIQEPGEPGIPGVSVTLELDLDGDGTVDFAPLQVTDNSGNYRFDNLPAGNHRVVVTTPAGTLPTTDLTGDLIPDSSHQVALAAGETNLLQDFGFDGTGSIGDRVYWDANGNGVQDAGEPGLPGVAVTLQVDLDGDGASDVSFGALTDAQGNYLFDNLPAADYTVLAAQPVGTLPTNDGDGAATPNQSQLTLAAGNANLDQDFGYVGAGEIGDQVYFDRLGDGGPFDPTVDRGMPGVDVTLEIDVNGDNLPDYRSTVATDAGGRYLFTGLIPGTYRVIVDPTDLPDAMGSQPTYDADGTASPHQSIVFVDTDVPNHYDQDFGYHAVPEYSITKDDGQLDVVAGQPLVYQIVVRNNGTLFGRNVVITDTYPTNALVNVTASDGGVVDPSAGTIHWNLPTLGMGESRTFTVSANVASPAPAGLHAFTNRVTVTDDGFNGVDPNPANNQDEDTDTVSAVPNYAITKSHNLAGPATPGQQFQYTLQVTNHGEQNGTGVVVTDQVPIHVLDAARLVSNDPANVLFDPSSGQLIWNVGDLDVGQLRTLVLTAEVLDPVAAGLVEFDNLASVTDDGQNGPDPDLTDNSTQSRASLVAAPDYVVVKSDSLTTAARPGDTFTYRLQVQNVGDQDGTGVVVTDLIPLDLIDPDSVSTDDPTRAAFDPQSGQLTWSLGALAGRGQEVHTLTIQVTIREVLADATVNRIVNTAVVTDDGQNGPDPTPWNNTSTVQSELLVFSYDAFHDFREPFHQWNHRVEEWSRDLTPLPVDPIFSGIAEPGTTLRLRIYDDRGDLVGDRVVVADAAGNWLANFPNTVIWRHPHRMEVEQLSRIHQFEDDLGFNLRRYFHPAAHHSVFFHERPTVDGAFRNLPSTVLSSMHAANVNPLSLGWRGAPYELEAGSTNTAAE